MATMSLEAASTYCGDAVMKIHPNVVSTERITTFSSVIKLTQGRGNDVNLDFCLYSPEGVVELYQNYTSGKTASGRGYELTFHMLSAHSTIDVWSTDSHNASKINFFWPSNPLKADAMTNHLINEKVLDCSAGNVKAAYILQNQSMYV